WTVRNPLRPSSSPNSADMSSATTHSLTHSSTRQPGHGSQKEEEHRRPHVTNSAQRRPCRDWNFPLRSPSSSITRPNARPLPRRFKLWKRCLTGVSRARTMSSRQCRRNPKEMPPEACTGEVARGTDERPEHSFEAEEGA